MDDPTPSKAETLKSQKIHALRRIWRKVFSRPSIGPDESLNAGLDEDFFDLGGDAWLAAELFTQIKNELGISAPPTTICLAPTIAALGLVLDNPRSKGPAVLLKPGANQAPPIFMFHGIGSSIIDLVPLVRRMRMDRPIYGLESRGNDGTEEPQERIEDIGESFLTAMRRIQPHGPYFLIGYSFGGLVALELAQQLKAQSEEIGLLAMLDSYPDRHYLSFAQYWRLLLQLAVNRVSGRDKPAVAHRAFLGQTGDQPDSLVHALQQVKDAHYRALRAYRPGFYNGEVKFIRAAVPSHFPADPVPVWSHLARRLEVESVPGDHVGMLTAGVGPLASLLDRYLRDASARVAERMPAAPQAKPEVEADS